MSGRIQSQGGKVDWSAQEVIRFYTDRKEGFGLPTVTEDDSQIKPKFDRVRKRKQDEKRGRTNIGVRLFKDRFLQ